jgi:hypothetical protein
VGDPSDCKRFEPPRERESDDDSTTTPASPPELSGTAADVLDRHRNAILRIDGVEGCGVGTTQGGDEAIIVYLRTELREEELPIHIEDISVVKIVTGRIEPL